MYRHYYRKIGIFGLRLERWGKSFPASIWTQGFFLINVGHWTFSLTLARLPRLKEEE